MKILDCRPPLFFLTGLVWLILSSLLGLGLLFGMVLATPLPSYFRLLHVHGALVGGVAQMILGAMVTFIPSLLMTSRDRSTSHPLLYLAINAGTIGLLVGFATSHSAMIATAGLVVVVAFLAVIGDGLNQVRSSLVSPPLNLWFYGVAVLVLLIGIGIGEAMALGLIESTSRGLARLGHIHLNLLGFVTLTIVGTMHNLFPTVLNIPLHSPKLARLTFFLMPAGVVGLVVGFMIPSLPVQIGAGVALIAASCIYGYNILRTWITAGRPRNIAADHLMAATLFLILAITTGVLVSVNYLWSPPKVPFGTLHLVAYTHLALIGFVLQTILGALSHLLPITFAVQRVPNNKKRAPYLTELTEIMGRWRALEVATLALGTLGLAVVASLVWQFPLSSLNVKVATWVTIALILTSLVLFTMKIGVLVGRRPSE